MVNLFCQQDQENELNVYSGFGFCLSLVQALVINLGFALVDGILFILTKGQSVCSGSEKDELSLSDSSAYYLCFYYASI